MGDSVVSLSINISIITLYKKDCKYIYCIFVDNFICVFIPMLYNLNMIGETNRIVNPKKIYRTKLKYAVLDLQSKKKSKSKKNYVNAFADTLVCTQCKRGMNKKLGCEQIKNHRENAPICIPCILGIQRRPIEQVQEETNKRFNLNKVAQFKKSLRKYNHGNTQR